MPEYMSAKSVFRFSPKRLEYGHVPPESGYLQIVEIVSGVVLEYWTKNDSSPIVKHFEVQGDTTKAPLWHGLAKTGTSTSHCYMCTLLLITKNTVSMNEKPVYINYLNVNQDSRFN